MFVFLEIKNIVQWHAFVNMIMNARVSYMKVHFFTHSLQLDSRSDNASVTQMFFVCLLHNWLVG
jgi:hypothetical protein